MADFLRPSLESLARTRGAPAAGAAGPRVAAPMIVRLERRTDRGALGASG